MQSLLNTSKPRAIVRGGNTTSRNDTSRATVNTSVQGVGIWNINARATFNGNANSVPILLHNVKSSSVSALVYPETTDTVLWFDYTTCALIGVSTYGWNRNIATAANIGQHDWFLDTTKTLALPTSVDVNPSQQQTPWTGSTVTLTHKRGVRFTGWDDYDPYLVGAGFSPTNGVNARATASIRTVSGGGNGLVGLRYTLSTFQNSTLLGSQIYDFFFDNAGFGWGIFPDNVLVRNSTTGVFSRQPVDIKWSAVSGF